VLQRGPRLAAAVRRWAQAPAALAGQLQLPLAPGQLAHVARAVSLLKVSFCVMRICLLHP